MAALFRAAWADLETTASLLERIRHGDSAAAEALTTRYLPLLQRWAHGRLPQRARDLLVTDDLVQISLMRALKHVEGFEARYDGAFLAYLRQVVLNLIRDEIRRAKARPRRVGLDAKYPAPETASPVEQAIGRQMVDRYDRALAQLPDRVQQAIFLRVELGFGDAQIAEAIGSRSPNAARVYVARALARLAEEMDRV